MKKNSFNPIISIPVLLVALAVALLSTSCIVHLEKQDTTFAEETFKVKDFQGIDIAFASNVHFSLADSCSVRVKAQKGALEGIIIKAENGVLNIEFDPFNHADNIIPIVTSESLKSDIYITAPSLNMLNITGSASFECKDSIVSDELFYLSISGSGKSDFTSITCPEINLMVSGSGSASAKSIYTGKSQLIVTGSGTIDANVKDAGQCMCSITGSGIVNADYRNCGSGESIITGSGLITLSGDLKKHKEEINGSGVIETKKLKVATK